MKLLEIFNTRELATIVWVIILFVYLIRKPEIRSSLLRFLKSVFKLWKIVLSMIIYIIFCIFILHKMSFWNMDLLKLTIFWFFGWASVMFINLNDIQKNKSYLKKVLVNILGLTVVISFITNFYTFPFIAELILLPIITILLVFTVMPQIKGNLKVNRLINQVLIVFGLIVLAINIKRVICNFQTFSSMNTLLEFLLPIILSLMFLPYLYLLFLYSECEQKKIKGK